MNKKPLPDAECLKYHGTPEKPDIKIFVSYRIDLDSEIIDNPIYIPVRCGAIFDERDGITMLGDDTGDNISEKREHFSELTVQYWAWKNIEADYYGLCHYRRFLGFSEKRYPADSQSIVSEQYLESSTIAKHHLDNISYMQSTICTYDAIIADNFDVRYFPLEKPHNDVWEYWLAADFYVHEKDLELMLKVLTEKFPDYKEIAKKYLKGHYFRGYNCFVLRKDLFVDLCEFEFQILFAVDKLINYGRYSEARRRTPAFLGEILYSIWLEKNVIRSCHYCQKQLLRFENTEIIYQLAPAFKSQNIPVVMISSNYYVPYAATCLKSIIYNFSKTHNYDIIILTNDMSKENQRMLQEMCCNYDNLSIRFYNPEPMLYPYKDKLRVNSRTGLLSFYRVAIPYFMKNYEKAVCIDCDLIFEADVAGLFDISFGDNYVAGVKDIWVQAFLQGSNPEFLQYCQKDYPLHDTDHYINTGVVIYNLRALREKYTLDDVMALSVHQTYLICEQDVINLLVENHVECIEEEWNFTVPGKSFAEHHFRYVPYENQQYHAKAQKGPFVIHWANEVKPWTHVTTDFADRFWFYARMTPFYELIFARLMFLMGGSGIDPFSADHQSKVRDFVDQFFPKGSKRRNLAKRILPKGSRRWNALKRFYHIMRRQ